jgi:hypothetical protein
MFLSTHDAASLEHVIEVAYFLHGSLTVNDIFYLVSCLKGVMSFSDNTRVIDATLLDVGGLSDFFADN